MQEAAATASKYTVLKIEKKENYAIVRLHRPTKFNAANEEVFNQLAEAVQELDADPNVGCIILTGQTFIHPKKGTPIAVFSAGADVQQFATLPTAEKSYDFIKLCFKPFKAIEESETPVIAAVNGLAFGFGFEIAGCCDMSFAGKSAKFALKEINHGAVAAWIVTRGHEKFPKSTIAYLTMSARELEPEEAKRLGVVIDVYEDDELLPKCEELAARIAERSFLVKTYIKRILNSKAIEGYQQAERFMPSIYATEHMQKSYERFLSGETKNVK